MKFIFGLLLVFLIYKFAIARTDHTKVWWKATEYQQVTHSDGSSPYYSLPVTADKSGNGYVFAIGFPNGGWVNGYGECIAAAKGQGFSTICSFTDNTGTGWDIVGGQ